MRQHTRVTIEKYWVLFCALCAYNSERLPASVEYFVCSTARGWRWCEDSTVASDLPLVSSKFSRDGNYWRSWVSFISDYERLQYCSEKSNYHHWRRESNPALPRRRTSKRWLSRFAAPFSRRYWVRFPASVVFMTIWWFMQRTQVGAALLVPCYKLTIFRPPCCLRYLACKDGRNLKYCNTSSNISNLLEKEWIYVLIWSTMNLNQERNVR